MKALYISNYRNNKSRDNQQFSSLRKIRNRLFGQKISGQDGFFVASLYTAFDVHEADLACLVGNVERVNHEYDVIFINYRCDANNDGVRVEDLGFLAGVKPPKVLVVTNAQASALPEDRVLDLFDVVFKREHYVDLDRYPISLKNKDKIRNTMLCCPLVHVTTKNAAQVNVAELGFKTSAAEYRFDLFFSGKLTDTSRMDILQTMHDEKFKIVGGLNVHKKYDIDIPKHLVSRRFSEKQYVEAIRSSKVNLALEGYGEYTFRHNEILFLCSFLISTPAIRGLKLPINLVENEHYVCYENIDDLVDKIRFYVAHEDERKKISSAGRALFEREYNFVNHGQYIKLSVIS